MIGIITAIIGDLASLMGCAMGLEVRVLQGQPSPHHHHIVLLPHSSNSPPPLPLCCNTVTRAFLRSPIGRRDSDHICRTRHITARHICVHVRCRRLRHRRFGAQRLHDGTNHPPPPKKKKPQIETQSPPPPRAHDRCSCCSCCRCCCDERDRQQLCERLPWARPLLVHRRHLLARHRQDIRVAQHGAFVYVCVCMCVCVYLCDVCMCMYMCVYVYVCVYIDMYVYI